MGNKKTYFIKKRSKSKKNLKEIMKKIIISGGNGDLAKKINFYNHKFKIYLLDKKKMNITNYNSILKNIKKIKPNYFIHAAALTSPMKQHEIKPIDSININIIGTCNVAKACKLTKTKLIYISTNFVYPGNVGNYKETDNLNPINLYGWSKLGGECAVKFNPKSLILRVCMTKTPFPHKYAFTNYLTNFLSNDEVAKIILRLLNKKGVINIGGKVQSPYNYAIKHKNKVIKKKISDKEKNKIGTNTSIDVTFLKKILKNK